MADRTNNNSQANQSLTNQKEKIIKEYFKYYKLSEEKTHINIIQLKSAFQAFILFCKEIGIDHNLVIEWLTKDESFMQSYYIIKQNLKVKTEFVETEKNKMLHIWNEM